MLQIGKLEDVVHGITELFGRLEERIESIDDTRVLFSQWVGKFGALERKTSKASLEHRIRHAPGIRVRILDLLNELVGDLEECMLLLFLVLDSQTVRHCLTILTSAKPAHRRYIGPAIGIEI